MYVCACVRMSVCVVLPRLSELAGIRQKHSDNRGCLLT